MVCWIIYYFYFQHVLEKKCRNADDYRRALLRFVLPVVILLVITLLIDKLILN